MCDKVIKTLSGKLFGLAASIFFIVGGLSGQYALKGTNSSEALVVVGVLFLLYNMFLIVTHESGEEERKRLIMVREQFATKLLNDPKPEFLTETYQYPLDFIFAYQHGYYQVYLNGEDMGQMASKTVSLTTFKQGTLSIQTRKVKNVLCAVNSGDSSKTYLFFEVTGAPTQATGFVLRSDGLFACPCAANSANGIKVLDPEVAVTQV